MYVMGFFWGCAIFLDALITVILNVFQVTLISGSLVGLFLVSEFSLGPVFGVPVNTCFNTGY